MSYVAWEAVEETLRAACREECDGGDALETCTHNPCYVLDLYRKLRERRLKVCLLCRGNGCPHCDYTGWRKVDG